LLCLDFAIFGGIIQCSQKQGAAIEKVDVIGGDSMTMHIEKGTRSFTGNTLFCVCALQRVQLPLQRSLHRQPAQLALWRRHLRPSRQVL